MAVTNLLFREAVVSARAMSVDIIDIVDARSLHNRCTPVGRVDWRLPAGGSVIGLGWRCWRCALLRIANATVAKVICL